jgi:hypothetical protein
MRKVIAACSLAAICLVPAVAVAQQPNPQDIPPPVPHDGPLTEADIQRLLDLARQELSPEGFATFERQLREGNPPPAPPAEPPPAAPAPEPVIARPKFTG